MTGKSARREQAGDGAIWQCTLGTSSERVSNVSRNSEQAYPSISRSLICAANVVGKSDASNLVIWPTPLFPSSKLQHSTEGFSGLAALFWTYCACAVTPCLPQHAGPVCVVCASLDSEHGCCESLPVVKCIHIITKDRGNALSCDNDSFGVSCSCRPHNTSS